MLSIAISGLSGKVGQEISRLASEKKQIQIVGALRHNGKYESLNKKTPQVLIDFSRAEFFEKALDYAVKNKIAFVSGTTGLSAENKKNMKQAAKKIPILWASNMSMGIVVLKKMIKELKNLSDYEFYVEETHHAQKKDSPSGTAITLNESLEDAIGKKTKEILSLRGGGVFGQHRIVVLGPEETITLEHNALNRTVFARGALAAAEWIGKQKAGLYSIDDIF